MRCLGLGRYCNGIVKLDKVARIRLASFIFNPIQATCARTIFVKKGEHNENGVVQNPFKLLKPFSINHGSL